MLKFKVGMLTGRDSAFFLLNYIEKGNCQVALSESYFFDFITLLTGCFVGNEAGIGLQTPDSWCLWGKLHHYHQMKAT